MGRSPFPFYRQNYPGFEFDVGFFFNSKLIDGAFEYVKWSRYDSRFFKAIRQVC